MRPRGTWASGLFDASCERAGVADCRHRPDHEGHDDDHHCHQAADARRGRHLERVPRGRRTAVNEISYANGKVVHTFAAPSADRLDKKAWCKKGSFCFWAGEDFTTEPPLTQIGVYLKCNEWMDLGRHGFNDMMSFVWNNTGSRVNLINHDDRGKRSNGHRYDKTLVRVQQGQVLDSLGRYNEQVDHVKRFC